MRNTLYYLLLVSLSIALYAPIFLSNGWIIGHDGAGHLFKIHKLMECGWKPWIEDWYAGFPLLRFHPPASYIVAAFFGKIFGNEVRGYAATLMLTSFIGAASLHTFLRKTGREPYIPPVLFILSPWIISVAYIEGNFPRANSIYLMPPFMLSVLLMGNEKRDGYIIMAAMALSAVMLFHHLVLVLFALVSVILIWENIKTLNFTRNLIKVGGICLLLTGFWYIPFLIDVKWANFWSVTQHEWLYRIYSVPPERFLAPSFLPILVLILLFSVLATLRGTITKRALFLIFGLMYLSTGYYSPTPWLNSFPLLRLIPPYRWLDAVPFLAAVLAGDALRNISSIYKKLLIGAIATLLLGEVILTNFPTVGNPSQETIELAHFLKTENSTGWRFFIDGGTSEHSYLPALTGKPTLNGWYHEGNPVDTQMTGMMYLLSTKSPASSLYLKAYSVKYYLSSDPSWKPDGYQSVKKIGKYNIYRSNVSFVKPINVLLVGNFYELPFEYAYMKKLPSTLSGFKTIIYTQIPSKEDEEKLRKFLKNRGVLIWIPQNNGTLFGIRAEIAEINNDELSSMEFNVSRFARFSYKNKPWYGPLFERGTPLIMHGHRVLLGYLKAGTGKIYLVGANLLYHIVYTNSSYELNVFLSLLPEGEEVSYRIIKYGDGIITLKLLAQGRTVIRVSEAYYPYWRASLDGKHVGTLQDKRTGLILVPIENGTHTLILRFRDPFVSLRTYSAFFWFLMTGALLTELRREKVKIRLKTP